MSHGIEKKKEEFDSAGEAIGYISLDQAILHARRLARRDEDRHRERLGWREIVWTEANAERREDSYRVVLRFKRPAPGLREEQMGEEEFIFGLTGDLEERQVLVWPAEGRGDNGSAPGSVAPTAEAPDQTQPGFPDLTSVWVPLPFRILLFKFGIVRGLLERVLGRESRRRGRRT